MGKYWFMVNSPGALAEFRREYHILDDVHLELAKKGDTPWGELDKCPLHGGVHCGRRHVFLGPTPDLQDFEVE
ncbi:hypothetical protein CsSME_00015317 [Camellia sinensis var. sinensis]